MTAEGRSFPIYRGPRLASALLVTWRLAASVSKQTHTMSVRTNQTGYKTQSQASSRSLRPALR
jgi:hypothetical protein